MICDSLDPTLLQNIKLIVTDMDGTLLAPGSILTGATRDAITKFDSVTKIPLILATGRCRSAALSRLSSFERDFEHQPGIFLNGAVVYGLGGVLIDERKFDPHVLETIVSMFENELNRVVVMPCSGDEIFAPESSEISMYLHVKYSDPLPIVANGYTSMLSLFEKKSIHMITLLTAPGEEHNIVHALNKTFNHMYTIVTSVPRQVSVLPLGSTKGAGLSVLTKHLNLGPDEVAAIGDADNDIEMLDFAGVAVAVNNACEEVKSHANCIVNSNSDPFPGVAQFLSIVSSKQCP